MKSGKCISYTVEFNPEKIIAMPPPHLFLQKKYRDGFPGIEVNVMNTFCNYFF